MTQVIDREILGVEVNGAHPAIPDGLPPLLHRIHPLIIASEGVVLGECVSAFYEYLHAEGGAEAFNRIDPDNQYGCLMGYVNSQQGTDEQRAVFHADAALRGTRKKLLPGIGQFDILLPLVSEEGVMAERIYRRVLTMLLRDYVSRPFELSDSYVIPPKETSGQSHSLVSWHNAGNLIVKHLVSAKPIVPANAAANEVDPGLIEARYEFHRPGVSHRRSRTVGLA